MYSVCALVAVGCLLAQTAHADDHNLIKAEAGRLPAQYNKFKNLTLDEFECDIRLNITELFDLPRKPVAVRLEVKFPVYLIQHNPELEISKDLLSASVIRYRPPLSPAGCFDDVLYVAVEDH